MGKHKGKSRKSGGLKVGQALIKRNTGGQQKLGGQDMYQQYQEQGLSILDRNSVDEIVAMAKLTNRNLQGSKDYQVTGPVIVNPLQEISNEKARNELQAKFAHLIRIPRRPKWRTDMHPLELDKQERAVFLEWRRQIARYEKTSFGNRLEEEAGFIMTPFEKNLEIWRQLWRVIERCDVVVQVIDARDPLLYYSQDLQDYAQKVSPTKHTLLLLNKADLLTKEARQQWSEYFERIGISYAFWSAFLAEKKNKEDQKYIQQTQDSINEQEFENELNFVDQQKQNQGLDLIQEQLEDFENLQLGQSNLQQQENTQENLIEKYQENLQVANQFQDQDTDTQQRKERNQNDNQTQQPQQQDLIQNQIQSESQYQGGQSLLSRADKTEILDTDQLLQLLYEFAQVSLQKTTYQNKLVNYDNQNIDISTNSQNLKQYSQTQQAENQQHLQQYSDDDQQSQQFTQSVNNSLQVEDYTDSEDTSSVSKISEKTSNESLNEGTQTPGQIQENFDNKQEENYLQQNDLDGYQLQEQIDGQDPNQYENNITYQIQNDTDISNQKNKTSFMIGLIGYPNVGKSSTINALYRKKKTAVAATPGKTKHFQTLIINEKISLCDCPGMVMPKFANSKAHLVTAGIIPIDRLTDVLAPVNIVLENVSQNTLESYYNVKIQNVTKSKFYLEGLDQSQKYKQSNFFLQNLAMQRQWVIGGGLPDIFRTGRIVLKDFTEGRIPFFKLPPSTSITNAPESKEYSSNIQITEISQPQMQLREPSIQPSQDTIKSPHQEKHEQNAALQLGHQQDNLQAQNNDLGTKFENLNDRQASQNDVNVNRNQQLSTYLETQGSQVGQGLNLNDDENLQDIKEGQIQGRDKNQAQTELDDELELDNADIDLINRLSKQQLNSQVRKKPEYKYKKKLPRSKGNRGKDF